MKNKMKAQMKTKMNIGSPIFRIVVLTTVTAGALGLWGCGQKQKEENASSSIVKQTAPKTLYQCPMHHQIIRDHPGTCPLCGMTLVPVSGADSTGHDHSADAGGISYPAIHLDSFAVQHIGVRTAPVERRLLGAEIRLDGKVTADESRVRSVTARVAGYVEKLYASTSGQTVREGSPLLELYSPDLVSAQEDLIQALQYRDGELAQSARQRLFNWGASKAFVASLEKTRRTERLVPVSAPLSGVLIRKNVIEGQNVMPGAEMFQIADLSRLWVTARVYQQDLATVKVGSPATVRLRNLPSANLSAKISFISPEMDPATRTAETRIEISNTPTLDLRPEMFAEVTLHGRGDSVLAVPEQALIRSGTRTLAIAALGEGRFQPREVRTGRSAEGFVEILEGLDNGETIVISAQFLIDSESNLRAVIEQMQAASHER